MLIPSQRPIPQHLSQPEPLRLPAVENRLDDIRREAGERQEPTDVGDCHILLLGQVGDRAGLSDFDPPPPSVRRARLAALLTAALKLLVMPAATALACRLFGIDGLSAAAAVLFAA